MQLLRRRYSCIMAFAANNTQRIIEPSLGGSSQRAFCLWTALFRRTYTPRRKATEVIRRLIPSPLIAPMVVTLTGKECDTTHGSIVPTVMIVAIHLYRKGQGGRNG